MTELESKSKVESDVLTGSQHGPLQEQGHSVYIYESAGIAERGGSVPIWLWIVAVTLLIWGAYYLETYWNAPIDPT